jgi:DNA repair exonuclease SbcCD nuclease subunit
VKFIHAADIHLDSPLTGLSTYADAPLDLLRSATRAAFSNLVSEAIELSIDFMLIAGDLYDGSWKDHNTGIYFCQEMGRLKQAGIPVYLLFGNHDAESEMTKKLLLPDNVFCFDTRKPSSFCIEPLKVVLHGQGFKDKETLDNLALNYPAPLPGYFNIGVLHTALAGNTAHANYAPCSLAQLYAKGYHYWALGHVHDYQLWEGPAYVVFPGNLQGRHIRETGPRGAVLVEADAQGVNVLQRLYVDVLRWHSLTIDVSTCRQLTEVVQQVGNELADLHASNTSALPYAVRLILTGKTAAHGELFGLESQLRQEILARAASLATDKLWIEKVKLHTSAADDDATIQARADAFSDLQALLVAAETDSEFLNSLQTDLLNLINRTPLELHPAISYVNDIRNGELQTLLREVRPGLVAHLAKLD